jgi:hypothetical protein
VAEDHATQRELSACYGQSATAGNINRALRTIYYSGLDDGHRCLFVGQVHDSLMFLVHRTSIHTVIPRIKEIMEEPTVIHGRSMSVPVDAKLGLTWGKKMASYSSDLTWEDLVEYEKKYYGDKYKVQPEDGITDTKVNLSDLDFDDPNLLDLYMDIPDDEEDEEEDLEVEAAE